MSWYPGQNTTYTNVENASVTGTSGNDLFIVQGTGVSYKGGAGVDTLYADWSDATDNITFINSPSKTQTINGVTVSGIERLLIATGSGDDTLSNVAYPDSNNEFYLGDGNDTLSIKSNPAYTVGWQIWDADGVSTYLDSGLSFDSIHSTLANAATFLVDYGLGYGGYSTTYSGAENVGLTSGDGNDLLIAQGTGVAYQGGKGSDTFYADWSDATDDITFINSPSKAQTVNGVTVSGVERLLIATGSGDDTLSNVAYPDSNNELDLGDGNDTLSIKNNTGYNTDWRIWDADGASTDLNFNSSFDSIKGALASAATFRVGWGYSGYGTTYSGAENVGLTIGDGYDLLIAQGKGVAYQGGKGSDTFYADWSDATGNIIFNNSPSKTQTVNGVTVSGVERLLIATGSGNDTVSNTLVESNDSIKTGAGNDKLDGGAGADTLFGGKGDDSYVVDNPDDSVIEKTNQGADTVYSSVDYTLAAHVENLVLTGEAVNGGGNGLDNSLMGNDADNSLVGGAGNDALDGGAGADKLAGGNGDDVYTVDDAEDAVLEGIGKGIDTVQASISYALPANLENLVLTGKDAIGGTGNKLANTLTGNAGKNILDGGDGDDTLAGGAGNDTLTGGAGSNTYVFSKGFGADLVNSYAAKGSNTDSVTFTDVASAEVAVSRSGLDAVLKVGTDQITFSQYFDHSKGDHSVAALHFSDGVTWTDLPVNEAPRGGNSTATLNEDTPYALAAADFGFSDPNDSPVNTLLAVKIASLPDAGTLTFDGAKATAGQFVSAADLDAGKLLFTPAANANGAGYASFKFQVQDDGGTANGGVDLDSTANKLTFDVTPVNDAPEGSDKTVTALEDTAYALKIADVGLTDPNDNPANKLSAVKIASLPGAGALTLDGAAVTLGQSISVGDIAARKLVFAPAANANGAGYAGFDFQVQDKGGTANGGVDLDATPNTLTFNVTPVRDDLNLVGTDGKDVLNGDLIDTGSFDTLSGLAGDDVLNGLAGKDTLIGGAGKDVLTGGLGKDTLTGGSGADKFVYTAAADTGNKAASRDVVKDFSHAQGDKIDVHAIDADLGTAGVQPWSFVAKLTGAGGEVSFNASSHQVLFDQGGDKAADFSIELTGVPSLSASDFIFV